MNYYPFWLFNGTDKVLTTRERSKSPDYHYETFETRRINHENTYLNTIFL